MVRFRRKKRRHSILDLSPLVDCVLQLLVFFMLSSTFAAPRIEISLPEARTGRTDEPPDGVTVTASADGELFVEDRKVEPADLRAALDEALDRSDERRVVFRGDRDIPYRLFVRVLDAARAAGATHVDIAHGAGTREPADASPAEVPAPAGSAAEEASDTEASGAAEGGTP